jgi:hypothetical protein
MIAFNGVWIFPISSVVLQNHLSDSAAIALVFFAPLFCATAFLACVLVEMARMYKKS